MNQIYNAIGPLKNHNMNNINIKHNKRLVIPNILATFLYASACWYLPMPTNQSKRDAKYTLESEIGKVTQQHIKEINEIMMDSPRNGLILSTIGGLVEIGKSRSCSIEN